MSNKKKKKPKSTNQGLKSLLVTDSLKITNETIQENSLSLEEKKKQFYGFNFKYLTQNSHYNFEFFKTKKSNQLHDAIKHITNEMFHVSQIQVKDRQNSRFKRSMTFKDISHNYGDSKFQEDMEIISLHNGDYRIVCFCEEAFSNILYVLAFDWDFSLYKH